MAANLNKSLEESDPDLFDLIEKEKQRQRTSLVLIASENFTSSAVLDALGSVMSNKYSEGYPGARYYGGNENIDAVETMCQQRALEAFGLSGDDWNVNVQSLSGSPANFAVYTALLQPHDRILSLDLPSGGHLSHGYQTDKKKVSAVSAYFETLPYKLDPATGRINYDEAEALAAAFRPKLVVAGASAYARLIDYERMRRIADLSGAVLLADMAHISGLVAAGCIPSPFEHCDVVMTTTHKSLRGPRGALIFSRKGVKSVSKKGEKTMYDYGPKIDSAVFPGLQGGPHNHTIAALATALKQAASPDFKTYQEQVMVNSKALCEELMGLGYDMVSGGTDNHLCLVDLRSKGIDGARAERVLEMGGLVTNKNTVPGDTSAVVPGGIRLGAPAMTSRGLGAEDFRQVGRFFDRAVQLAVEAQTEVAAAYTGKGKPKLKDYFAGLSSAGDSALKVAPRIAELREEVAQFSGSFPAVGFDESKMRYRQ